MKETEKRFGAAAAGGLATAGKLVLLIVVVALIAAFFLLDLGQYASLDYLKSVHSEVVAEVREHPIRSSLVYFFGYVLVTGLSLPGAAVMTVAGGAVFGLPWGLVLVSFASSFGATIAMLISRTLLGNWVQEKYGEQLASINAGRVPGSGGTAYNFYGDINLPGVREPADFLPELSKQIGKEVKLRGAVMPYE